MNSTLKVALYWVGLGLFAALFVVGGIGHLVATDRYMKIMPSYLPYHRELVLISGICEVALGLMLLIPATKGMAGWGLIALLIAVFPANIDMYQHADRFPNIPLWALATRLPLQALLILWAWAYARRGVATRRVATASTLVLAMMSANGCGVGPETSRLAKGSAAVTKGVNGKPAAVKFAASTEQVPDGTAVQVVSDEAQEDGPGRQVLVNSRDARFHGLVGMIDRGALRGR